MINIAKSYKITILSVFISFLFVACGSDTSETINNNSKDERQSAPLLFGTGDRIVRLMKLGDHAEAFKPEDNPVSIAAHNKDFWVGTETGLVLKLKEIADEERAENLELVSKQKVGCKVFSIFLVSNRVWVVSTDCANKNLIINEINPQNDQVISSVKFAESHAGIFKSFVHNNYFYALISDGFKLVRVSLNGSSNIEEIDFRKGEVGTYGVGDMALLANNIWVMDKTKKQFLKIDLNSFSTTSTKTFDQSGINIELDFCVSGKDVLYCWGDKNMIVLDPEKSSIVNKYTGQYTFHSITPCKDKLYIGTIGSIDELDLTSLTLQKEHNSQRLRTFLFVE